MSTTFIKRGKLFIGGSLTHKKKQGLWLDCEFEFEAPQLRTHFWPFSGVVIWVVLLPLEAVSQLKIQVKKKIRSGFINYER
ncbi:hypothetical protein C5S39_10455 [Candidatus Methanophagaceae archaeon]|jgi:hypothetical protein|nr:hypothetical protein C5S39_10455 [Methanophagales archaeon]